MRGMANTVAYLASTGPGEAVADSVVLTLALL